MQRGYQKSFKERLVYYASTIIKEQLPKGLNGDDYELKELAYKLIELPNFAVGEDELYSDLEKWLFILKNMSSLKKIPVYLRKPIFQRVFQIAEVGKLTKEERMLYDASLKAKRDWNNTVAWAAEQAAKEAAEKADQEATARERAKAEAEKFSSARSLKQSGVANQLIADSLKLPLEVVEKL